MANKVNKKLYLKIPKFEKQPIRDSWCDVILKSFAKAHTETINE